MNQRNNPVTNKKSTHTFKAHVSGMYYSASSPGAKPYVAIGQKVKAGDTLCHIEVMKMFNEFKADRDGIITKCHTENGTLVNASQRLFTIEPTMSNSATLFKLINDLSRRTSLNTQQKKLIVKLKKLKEHLAENTSEDFEDCADKLHAAISSAFNQDTNLTNAISELDNSWKQYWNGISETYAWHEKLKGFMVRIFAYLGAIAGLVAGTFLAPATGPVGGVVGFLGGGIGGATFGNWLADICFFSHSKEKLEAAVKLSGKISDIKDDIQFVSVAKNP